MFIFIRRAESEAEKKDMKNKANLIGRPFPIDDDTLPSRGKLFRIFCKLQIESIFVISSPDSQSKRTERTSRRRTANCGRSLSQFWIYTLPSAVYRWLFQSSNAENDKPLELPLMEELMGMLHAIRCVAWLNWVTLCFCITHRYIQTRKRSYARLYCLISLSNLAH